jgi:hypothetical protein
MQSIGNVEGQLKPKPSTLSIQAGQAGAAVAAWAEILQSAHYQGGSIDQTTSHL